MDFRYRKSFLYKHAVLYPTPGNLNYLWNFGSSALAIFAVQIITGLLLVLWYIPHIDMAFPSVNFITNEVYYGWLIKALHSNGASFFFIAIYAHILRNIYYGSYMYPREGAWYSGVLLFILLILTAFLGYVLPWGQMSYWAATVISSLISTIPIFGDHLLIFIWGGLAIGQPTLTRIFGLHFLLPFILLIITSLHLILLHREGSSNTLGVINNCDKIGFHPYYTIKDFLSFLMVFTIYFYFVCFKPDLLGHTDNYILANPGVTPLHIVPEWYFLPFYGILRSVPSKVGGVILLFLALVILFLLPRISVQALVRSGDFRPIFRIFYGIFIAAFVLLGWSGGKPIESPFYTLCQISTLYYFSFFLFLSPACAYFEASYWQLRVSRRLARLLKRKQIAICLYNIEAYAAKQRGIDTVSR